MKIRQPLLATLVAIGLSATLPAAPADTDRHPLIDVVFLEPTKFTDVRDSEWGTHERTTYLEQLRDHLRERVHHYVPPGYRLAVTFKDIDMAGEFEPWRGPQFSDIRIIKDIYPPRIELAFQMTDAEGNVVKSGERTLRDLAFMMNLNAGFRNDPVRHEKALLDNWLRREFSSSPKG